MPGINLRIGLKAFAQWYKEYKGNKGYRGQSIATGLGGQ